MPIRAGDLRESVTVQVSTEQTNDYGEATLSWADFATRRAAIRSLRVDEVMSAQQPYTVATYEVEFRYVPGLKAGMRLVWNSRAPARTLDVTQITEDANREGQRLVCREQVS
jgi:SPP1 family predicted phage head-tail adaptor